MTDLPLVALEEHCSVAEVEEAIGRSPSGPIADALGRSVADRLAFMDEVGCAFQVLSLAPPGLQGVLGAEAPAVARRANDALAAAVAQAPSRLAGFAALPTAAPKAAADELRRAVLEKGLRGALVNGPTDGRFLDHESFGPILAAAAELKVPIYLHPGEPMAEVREAYLEPYATTHPMFRHAAWGYTIETGTHAMRLALSDAFERHPDLQVILGHLGEAIPYLLVRIEEALARNTPMKNFGQVFRAHFHITTSGFFSDAALACALAEMGPERIMFSIDTPYASAEAGVRWFRSLQLEEATLRKIAYANAARLLGLEIRP